jgi:hypothetical protein
MRGALKALIPNRVLTVRILRGPFRGAVLQLNPQDSLRKIFGLYEHELNQWLETALQNVETVLDVGANDGYFTLGCAAAFQRLQTAGEVIAFEPDSQVLKQLRMSIEKRRNKEVEISLYPCLVGSTASGETTTLDAVAIQRFNGRKLERTLIKMDVEGAEVDVIAGGSMWLTPSNYFLIEVHEERFLKMLTDTFSAQGLRLKQINQRPLPILGYENRSRQNWWLVSEPARES